MRAQTELKARLESQQRVAAAVEVAHAHTLATLMHEVRAISLTVPAVAQRWCLQIRNPLHMMAGILANVPDEWLLPASHLGHDMRTLQQLIASCVSVLDDATRTGSRHGTLETQPRRQIISASIRDALNQVR